MSLSAVPPKPGLDEWIVADIGGTNARFGRWTATEGLDARWAAHYRNDDFPDLPALFEQFRRDTGATAERACLALALPLSAGEMRMTNRPWAFTPEGLRARLRLKRLRLVNDFAAAAAGLGALTAADFTQWGGEPEAGNCLIVGPGTGLGAAVALSNGRSTRILGSEAGHMGAAPTGADALGVVERARLRYGRVSWERLLCGDGLSAFDSIASSADKTAEAAEVAARAQAGDAAARRAAVAFVHALGEFAGDLCLAVRATGGVYLVGGVLQGLGRALDPGALRAGFENKGRFSGLLRKVPCYLVHADDLALRGLARILEGSVQAPLIDSQSNNDGKTDFEP
jgi:glucokinase